MVSLFSMDVPFMELLTIYIILTLFSLVIVLIELGRLKRLVAMEGFLSNQNKDIMRHLYKILHEDQIELQTNQKSTSQEPNSPQTPNIPQFQSGGVK